MAANPHSPRRHTIREPAASFPAEKRATPRGSSGGGKRRSGKASTLLLPVDDAEHQLQVLSDARSPAALQLLGYASAAQRAAGVRRLVALLRLLQIKNAAYGPVVAIEWYDRHGSAV